MNKQYVELRDALVDITSTDKMDDFLKGILTPKELMELPMRLKIVTLLKRGMPQSEIAQKLGVGVATVTRGSKELQKGRFKHVK